MSHRAAAGTRDACPYQRRRGDTPPTNEYHRAIWEQVRADKERGPAKPIAIRPPG